MKMRRQERVQKKIQKRIQKRIQKICYVLGFTVLVCVISLLLSQRISSKTRAAVLFDNSSFEQAETEYIEAVSAVLHAYKCFYSGINLTREVSLDGERSYTVYLHNNRFNLLQDADFAEMKNEIAALAIIGNDNVQYYPEIAWSR